MLLLSQSARAVTALEPILEWLGNVTRNLHQLTTAEGILDYGLAQLRAGFKADRALMYRGRRNGGAVVAESVSDRYPSNSDRSADNSWLSGLETRWKDRDRQSEIWAISDIEKSDLEPRHIRSLQNLQIKALLVAPVRVRSPVPTGEDPQLWGLLIVQKCRKSRVWTPIHRHAIGHLTTQMGLALERLEMLRHLEASRDEASRWREALEAAGDGVWDWNVETGEVFFCHCWQAMLGYDGGEIGNTLGEWESRIHPDDRDRVRDRMRDHFAGRTPTYKSEYRISAKDGSWKWVLDRGKVVTRQADGAPRRVVGTHVDLTERKQLEESRRESQQKYRTLFEILPVGVSIADAGGNLIEANPATERILGIPRSEHDRRTCDAPVWQAVYPDGTPMPTDEYPCVRALREGRIVAGVEKGIVRPDGGISWISVSAAPIPLDNYGVAIVYIDIGDRKAAERALLRQSRRERAFNEVVKALRSSLDLDAIFEAAVVEIADLLKGEVSIVQYLPERQCWRNRIVRNQGCSYPQQLETDIPDAGNPFSARLKQLQVVQIDNTAAIADPVNRELARMFPGAWLLVPIAVNGEIWGSLTLARPYQATPWHPEEVDLGRRVADQLAIAIHQANLYQQLQDSHEQYALVLRSIGEGIWDRDLSTDRVRVSDRYWEILGHDPKRQPDTSFEAEIARIHPDDRETIYNELRESVESGRPYRGEMRIRHRRGHYIWIAAKGQAIRDGEGNPVRILGTIEDIGDRKAAEEALRQSVSQYRSLAEAMPQCLYRKDRQGKVTYVNPALVRWSGMAEADLLGKTAYDVYPPALAAQYAADDARVLETGEILDTVEEHRVPYRDDLIFVQVVKSPIRDGDGHIVGTQGIFWEVTERIKLENALKASEALLNSFFSQSLDGFFFMMLDEAIAWEEVDDIEAALDDVFARQKITRVNDAMLAQYGATREEFLGWTPADFFRHDPQQGRAVWKRFFDAGHLHIETDERKLDGTPMIVEGDYVCLYDDRGRIVGHFGIQRDVTARKRAENDLREREEAFRALAENSPDYIMRCDRRYRFLYVNPPVAALAGLPDTAFLGKTCEELGFSPHLVALWHGAIDRVFATGIEESLEYEMQLQSGNHVFYSRVAPELEPDGEVASVLVVARDITDLKQAENALRQQVEQEHTLRLIAGRIRETLDLDAILSAAVTEIWRSLDADRAIVFQLTSDRAGVVIQEAVSPEYPVTATLRWEDECFPSECYEFYRRGRGRIVPDVARDDWGSCLAEFMGEIGVLSKMVAPIVQRGEDDSAIVWGLLVTHACAERRQWKPEELALLEQVADQLAIAIQQSELYRRLQAANRELERLSNTDALTQIANRRHFDERLKREWRRTRREQKTLSLILCDIDYFKQYNDTYGHPAGDGCLIAIAQTLQRCINRETDCLARYGGEEFVVILPYTNLEGATFVVEKMRAAIADLNLEHQAHKSADRVTLSFGITATDFQKITAIQTLLDRADRALYQAKERGRNQYAIEVDSDG